MSNVRADNFGKRDGSSSIPADTLLQGTAKSWCNLNGTGTIAQRDSFNVSSIVDNGVGDYSTNFAAVMPNANYGFNVSISNPGSGVLPYTLTGAGAGPFTNLLRSSSRIPSDFIGNAAVADVTMFMTLVHGDPA